MLGSVYLLNALIRFSSQSIIRLLLPLLNYMNTPTPTGRLPWRLLITLPRMHFAIPPREPIISRHDLHVEKQQGEFLEWGAGIQNWRSSVRGCIQDFQGHWSARILKVLIIQNPVLIIQNSVLLSQDSVLFSQNTESTGQPGFWMYRSARILHWWIFPLLEENVLMSVPRL